MVFLERGEKMHFQQQLKSILENNPLPTEHFGNVLAKLAGRDRVKAEEIDAAIGDYIEPTSLLCTDTATNYKSMHY